MAGVASRGGHAVVACSALKQTYRDALIDGVPDVRWVYLKGRPDLLRDRVAGRTGHYAGPALIDSQLADLEPPSDALVLEAARPVNELVEQISRALAM